MSDTLKDATVTLLGLALFAGYVANRAEHAIVHDLARTMKGGTLNATVHPRGLFGLLIGQADRVVVTGHGFRSDQSPFEITRGTGIRGRVRSLRFDFHDITLRGLPVRHFRAELPNVTLDIGRAFFDERIIVRAAGEGTTEAVVNGADLAVFLARKFPQLRNIVVDLRPGVAAVTADTGLLGAKTKIEASGRLAVRDGRFIEITDPVMKMNGKEVTPAFALNILKSINPILDTAKDIGLGDTFYATGVEAGEGTATMRGRARVPQQVPAPPCAKRASRPGRQSDRLRVLREASYD
jgi:hypothetical protein